MFFTSKLLGLSRSTVMLLKVLIFVLFAAKVAESVAVMSIDLGAEFLKIAIVKPGVPMEIVLNKESRRKTPLAVSLRSSSDREFGEMAMSQAIKKPKTAYLYVTQILAKSLDSPAVKSYKERYPFYDIKEDPTTGTIYFQHDESTRYTPEELLAMILDYCRELAADFGEQGIDAAVIAVPPYFNQAERKAVLRAAEMVNLKVLQLVNTNIAAGLNYGVFRRKDFNTSGTTLMFFDMGGSGTVATVATFQMVKNKDDYEPNPQLTVRGIGFDRNLGGNQFTMRLANHLAKLFMEKTKKDIFKDPKAINKMYKEAERVKNVLSANADHVAQIESLMDDVDFKAKVTREEFETLCADLFDKVKKPIEDAIKSSEVMHDELTTVILVGGSTRIPKVQDELLKATKKKELGKNLNTDEAPALGAVYQCAYQSKGYKVKKFHIKDVNAYPIVVDFERFLEENDAAASSSNNKIRRVLFDRLNPFPQKKVMTFSKHTKNFDFSVNYGDLSFYDDYIVKSIGSLNISQVSLSNVEDIFKKHGTDDSKGIKVHFKLDDSGILHLDKIDVSFEKITEPEESTLSKIGNTISSFFGSSTDEEKKVESEQQQQETTTQSSTTKEPEAGKKEEGTNSTDKTTEEKLNATANANLNDTALNATKTVNLTVLREEVKFESVQIDLKPIEKQLYDESVSKLQAIKEKEKEKRKRAMAFNSLETFIFDTRDKLNQEEFIKCSTEKEREAIGAKLDEVDAWLSEADDTVETKMFQEKLTELKNVSRDVFYRLSERRLRPKKLDELKDVLNRSSSFLGTLTNYTGEDLPLTEVERSTLEKLINTTKEWRVKMLNEQAKAADNEQPKLTSIDISDKIDALKREVNYLVSKIKYFRPKTTKKPSTATKTNSTTNDNVNKTETEGDAKKKQDGEKTDEENSQNDDEKTNQQDFFDQSEQESTDKNENKGPIEEDTYYEEDTTTESPQTKNPEL